MLRKDHTSCAQGVGVAKEARVVMASRAQRRIASLQPTAGARISNAPRAQLALARGEGRQRRQPRRPGCTCGDLAPKAWKIVTKFAVRSMKLVKKNTNGKQSTFCTFQRLLFFPYRRRLRCHYMMKRVLGTPVRCPRCRSTDRPVGLTELGCDPAPEAGGKRERVSPPRSCGHRLNTSDGSHVPHGMSAYTRCFINGC